jgi:YidC/Oxa1 family membrane protein insertase
LEIADLPSLRTGNWEVLELPDTGAGPAVEFRFRLDEADLKKIGAGGALEIVKRYRLTPLQADQIGDNAAPAYNLTMDLELHNVGPEEQQIAFCLDGPTGLPTEGWWYSNKIHPRFMKAAGARDVVWSTPSGGRGLIGATVIYKDTKEAEEKGQSPSITLFSDTTPQSVDYIGVDTPYFAVVLQPEEGSSLRFEKALAIAAGDVGTKKKSKPKTTNSTFRLISEPLSLAPGDPPYTQHFTVFSGPKQPALLANYGLDRVIEYGWFRWIAQILASVLHFFERLPFVNYGLAIIMLTVLVRSCMIPLSRKATKNAQMMQELAPEMKRISEKYKNDMEKRAAAQRELFSKNSYNPFGGCLLMLIQLPIFIGLYRALSTDVELRQAPLIPGLSWCSNLAGPDMLWYWKPYLPAFFADETGWLGPYFNILPIITIILFLVQQKMFMPPATDDQTRMQQQMMKFMMLFMGVLFFRVPSGLCVYFIASSLWGVAERKLLPQVGKKKGGGEDTAPVGKKPDASPPSSSPTKKIASFAEKLSNKLGADANVRTARSNRKPKKGR